MSVDKMWPLNDQYKMDIIWHFFMKVMKSNAFPDASGQQSRFALQTTALFSNNIAIMVFMFDINKIFANTALNVNGINTLFQFVGIVVFQS